LISEYQAYLYPFLYDKKDNPENRHTLPTVYPQCPILRGKSSARHIETIPSRGGLQCQGCGGQLQADENPA
jgi:hypothetical protein